MIALPLIFIIFLTATLVCLLAKNRRVIEFSSVIASAISCASAILVALLVARHGAFSEYSFFYVDALSALVLLIITTVGLAATAYSVPYLRQETKKQIVGSTGVSRWNSRVREYFILLNLFMAAMCLAITVSGPIFAWIFLEATTLATALLISFYNKPSAIEGAWKYLVINSVGLLLAFFGTLLYLTSAPAAPDASINWQFLLTNTAGLNPLIAKIAFIFVVIGYGTKIGFVPMHTWKPDAYSKAPAPIGALFSGALLPVAFVIMLKFKVITDASVGVSFSQNVLIVFGLLSIAVSAIIIFAARNYKRLLAYSGIENAGLMALGFGFGGLGTFAAVLHMIYHSFIKSSLFFNSGNFLLKYGSAKIASVKGAIGALPVTSMLFLAGFFAIVGMPPLGVFFTKLYIFSAGMENYLAISFLAMCFTVILFIGFFKHVTGMVFGLPVAESVDSPRGGENIWLIIPSLFLMFLVLLLSFYLPPFILTLVEEVAKNY